VLVDQELADVMRGLRELGGARKLFHYLDEEGKARAVKPGEVNDYLKAATAPEFSTKDFRTWGGTLLAAVELAEIGKPADEKEVKKEHCPSSEKRGGTAGQYAGGLPIVIHTPRRAENVRIGRNPRRIPTAAITPDKTAGAGL
jgi:hypothetical protein